MVPGRFINAYSTIDWTLGVVFRARYVDAVFPIMFANAYIHVEPAISMGGGGGIVDAAHL